MTGIPVFFVNKSAFSNLGSKLNDPTELENTTVLPLNTCLHFCTLSNTDK